MKPKNTELPAARRRERRKNAIKSAGLAVLLRIAAAGVLLWARAGLNPSGLPAKLMLIVTLFNIGSVLPIAISLKARLKEIEGGEEDAAAQY